MLRLKQRRTDRLELLVQTSSDLVCSLTLTARRIISNHRPAPAPETLDRRLASFQHPPTILIRRIITPQEAEKLFQMYFLLILVSNLLADPVVDTSIL